MGLCPGPLNVMHWRPPKLVTVFPQLSVAVMVSLKAVPAIWVAGVGSAKVPNEPLLTAKLPELAVAPSFSVSDVEACAAKRVIGTEA